MSRLKTFLTYVLLMVAFFVASIVLEHGLVKKMYYDMSGIVDSVLDYNGKEIDLEIKVLNAKSTNVNGYIELTVTNNTDTYINEAYVKVILYSKSNVHGATKYMEVKGLSQNETRVYKLKFKGSYIKRYKITAEKEFPGKKYIFNFFGYDIDTRNIFGIDLSQYINTETFASFGKSVFYTIQATIKAIPAWAWIWAWMIVLGVW